jgi:hypothetical protein
LFYVHNTDEEVSQQLICSSDAIHIILASRSFDEAEVAQLEIEALNPKAGFSTVLLHRQALIDGGLVLHIMKGRQDGDMGK